jgi:polysaccharide biosynthesis protein PelD
LKLIAVLVAHGVDHLLFGAANPSVKRFIASFDRVYQDFSRFKLDSTLVRLSVATADLIDVYEQLRLSIRSIDLICRAREKDQPVIWLLLPLTNGLDARAWLQRVEIVPTATAVEVVAINEIAPQRIRSLEPC